MTPTEPRSPGGSLAERAALDLVRYANGWEDAEVLVAALGPLSGKRVLSIAAAGDNSFVLLAEGAEVMAVDLSPAQLALVELKAAAVRSLDYAATLAFLGVRPGADRWGVYERLRPDLSPAARAFWDARRGDVEGGVVHAGKIERYFRLFRRVVLPLVHRRATIEALMEPRDEASRRRFYAERWDGPRWRLLFRLFFSRVVLGRLGRDPEMFRYVEGAVAETILARTRRALTAVPLHDNPYVEYILRRGFVKTVPPWLRRERWEALRAGLARLTLHQGSVEDAADAHRGDGFDGFNLSDVFEYMDAASAAGVYRRLVDAARPGARLAYWNLFVPRRRPDDLADRVRSLDDVAAALFARDRAFVYGAFVLEEVAA